MPDQQPSDLSVSIESAPDDSRFTPPQISLPVGGGAIRGIGEKFATNPVTGTASLTVPITLSQGRSSFGPQLSLSYDSGIGNSAFGMGCQLSLPAITRKTEKGLPQYRDYEESDVFILSGTEDLVPVLEPGDAGWALVEFERDGYRVKRYRPRVEGLFARIERWTRLDDGVVHWRSITKDNVFNIYGFSCDSRIADPVCPDRVFSWLICQSYDDRGNAIVYDYAAENDHGVDLSCANERNRTRTANRYLKRIRYGNRRPLLEVARPGDRNPLTLQPHLETADWMFEAVLDYDEGHYLQDPADADGQIFVQASPEPSTNHHWPIRKDPFSNYRSGFEVRTYRLCRRVLMFHRFPEELGVDHYLVRSTEFEYEQKSIGSFMIRVTESGYKRRSDGCYLPKSLPTLDLSYTASPLGDRNYDGFHVCEVDARSAENLPEGIDGGTYRWVDLDGEGISGVLVEEGSAWFYKPNLGNGCFGSVETLVVKPSTSALNSGRQQFVDVAGDGNLDLVELSSNVPGFYERTFDAGWRSFRAFRSLPVRDWNDTNLKFVDVTGDGIADILITEEDILTWHPSLLRTGFGEGVRVRVPHNEEDGPRVLFGDGTQSIYLADLSGDGLADIVRIRNGEICYWPNLGYGRFGPKITMANPPWFDSPDGFDQQRIRLADTDGSGTTDILYFGRDALRIYLNQAGNGWSDARVLRQFPIVDNLTAISVVDLLGRGTACVLWSSPLPHDSDRPLRYIDLMAGEKPHLLVSIQNNLGAETRVEYASSTEFYLADKAAGNPWITRLAFPVHVVKRIETYDWISRNRFVTNYRYHHGYFDGPEREFRGFGMVEKQDTEEYAALTHSDSFPTAENIDAGSNVPPVLTKTWFHTGAYLENDRISQHYQHEYYHEGDARRSESPLSQEQIEAMLLEDSIAPAGLTPEETREAYRSLKGAVLRKEVYALDGTAESSRPYTVSESNYTIKSLQPRHLNRHAVFFTHAREVVSFSYERKLYSVDERKLCDPRVSHSLILRVDDYGNELRSATVAYGRRHADADPLLTTEDHWNQKRIWVTCKENQYTNPILSTGAYRAPLPAGSSEYELFKIRPKRSLPDTTTLFRFTEVAEWVRQAGDGRHDLPFADVHGVGATENHAYRRLTKCQRTLYRKDNLEACLPLGTLESRALPFERYTLGLTSELLLSIYQRGEEDLLPDLRILHSEGGYVLGENQKALELFPETDPNGYWWVPSGSVFYSSQSGDSSAQERANAESHFFLPRRFRDPFGNESIITYDSCDLLVVQTEDALKNKFTAGEIAGEGVVTNRNDYRVLQPALLTDPNGNRTAVAFDALGLVGGSALMGKITERLGDSLVDFVPDLTPRQIKEFFSDPNGPETAKLLGNATARIIYDFGRFSQSTNPSDAPSPVYAATIQRETHLTDLKPGQCSKIQIGVSYSDGFNREIQRKVQTEPGLILPQGSIADPRWVASGWTIYNNKGKPVRKYEPFFDDTHAFRFGLSIGVSPTLFYDPVGRTVATLHPDHSWEKVVFDPWRQVSWDVNDTLLIIDPKLDPDVGVYFRRIPQPDYVPTWYGSRINGALGRHQQIAAKDASIHAATPTTAVLDTLGRVFLTITYNRYLREETIHENHERTLLELDIQGNQCAVIDALARKAAIYKYDMLGARAYQHSIDAGNRWMLNNSAGKAQRSWDSRGHRFRYQYDALQRPLALFVRIGNRDEKLAEHIVYGEGQPDDQVLNLRTQTFQQFDQAGIITNEAFDFKGNLLTTARRLLQNYRGPVNWLDDEPLESETFTSRAVYDALNRILTATAPDGSVIRPTYDKANLLRELVANLKGSNHETAFVTDIEYNARSEREWIEYANGARTTYSYDPNTFRLLHLSTAREERSLPLQQLAYTYDPVGNIARIEDAAQQTLYFDNQVVTPSATYQYDARYRLIAATSREHLGQSNGNLNQPELVTESDKSRTRLPQPGDGKAMGKYVERYRYDSVGNILQVKHTTKSGHWTRDYLYHRESNRLLKTSLPGDSDGRMSANYSYDNHGNMLEMPHLPTMRWDFKDQLQSTSQQIVKDGTGETTYYVYDSAGQRVRKITERSNGSKVRERIYLPGFELYREYDHGGVVSLERETLPVMDGKRRIALVETRTIGQDNDSEKTPRRLTRYQFSNHLQSALLELDESARIISYEEYFPYGSTSYQAVRSQTQAPKRYRYTGKERDEENKLNYHGARYYAPWLGRWVSSDPVGMAGGMNSYAYAFNNPVRLVDPRGTQPETVDNLPRDEEGNIYIGHEVIEIHDRAPPLAPDEKARRGGTTNIVTLDEFERERNFNRYPPGYKRTLYDEAAEAMWITDPEQASQQYYGELNAAYNTYREAKAVELQDDWDRTDRAVGAVHEILAFEVSGVALATGIGAAGGVVAFARGLAFSAVLAGSTSTGGLSGCGTLAGFGGVPMAGGPGALPAAIPAAATETLETIAAKLGLSAEELAQLNDGELVFGNFARGQTQAQAMFSMENQTLKAGILSIKAPVGAEGWDSVKAFLAFKNSSMDLARQLGANTLRLEGNIVVNPDVEAMLLKLGFQEYAPNNFFLNIPVR